MILYTNTNDRIAIAEYSVCLLYCVVVDMNIYIFIYTYTTFDYSNVQCFFYYYFDPINVEYIVYLSLVYTLYNACVNG